MQKRIIDIETEAKQALTIIKTLPQLEEWEVTYLGRKSALNEILKNLKNLTTEEKRIVGPLGNAVKQRLFQSLATAREAFMEQSIDWDAQAIDVTAPGVFCRDGHLHPITRLTYEIEDIFSSLGFSLADGPEVESEWYNFDALNVPADHPARDMQDTFWLASSESKQKTRNKKQERYLLRTQTSAVQVRYMETHKPPFRIIIPGRIFRNEATDVSHEHTFHQFECLMVDEPGKVSVATFKYIAETFFSSFFGKKVNVRLRPSFFPFTEPSFEFDISCVLCGASGCPVCKQSGWLEIGGAGMVHQKVFEAAGYKRGQYQGFAWGFGLTRLAMMKYKITDIRLLMSGDLRFIRQF
ncbi:MAG: phenylalanine--tRNA ligase subunit alpha [Candidatus Moranbacteria bacterium]|nr:phenylalanine--tRNA ligase subunit alpha [Candidatus Moranbacteria bacterium]